MEDQDKKSKDILPEDFSTLEEFSEFWDTHSTADYEEAMEPCRGGDRPGLQQDLLSGREGFAAPDPSAGTQTRSVH
jgi:hypothetical protein